MTRRSLLAGVGIAGVGLLAACASGTSAPAAPTSAPAAATSAPTAAPAQPAVGAAPTATPAQAAAPASAQAIQLNWWTHGAEEVNKKKMLGILVDNYHAKNPNTTVTITWTQMPGIWQQLQAAFTADSGYPDLFWFDGTHQQSAKAGWVADLTNALTWANVSDWAKNAGPMPGPDGKDHVYLFAEYATSGELYYNKKMFNDDGIKVPDTGSSPRTTSRMWSRRSPAKGWPPLRMRTAIATIPVSSYRPISS